MFNQSDPTISDPLLRNEDGFAFGATPKLTTTLKRLVRAYPKDIGIIKEFIQNADDAGASCVKIIMDWRTHPTANLPDPRMKVLLGPALLIFNDAVFSDGDLTSIQNIGESVKQVDTSKIGRFGLGFNATYNVTDYPSLLTRQYILFFDPHLNVIPGADYIKPGRGWDLTQFYKEKKPWQTYKGMLAPFQILDSKFIQDQEYFDGTLFRLPLRTNSTYLDSQIKQEPFTCEDFSFILDQMKRIGPELLLFLKNVTEITVSEIKPGSDLLIFVLGITTENEAFVRENRQQINQAIGDKPEQLLESIRIGDRELPKISYTHCIRLEHEGYLETQEWRIVAGLFADDTSEILKITDLMVQQKEKAFPWAGCAARIRLERNGFLIDEKVEGQAYCLLPLGIATGLPVHINGVFDLDESRKMLTSGDMRGGDENRVIWNRLLVKHCVSRAYAGLIIYLAEDLGDQNIKKFYDYWPDPGQVLPPALSELTKMVYHRLADKKVLCSAADEKWKSIRELVFLQNPEGKLQEALLAEKFPLPRPLLPSSIINGFKLSGVNPQFISPKWLRDKYRVTQELHCALEDAPKVSLRKQEWVEALLQYCLIDSPGKDLKGLPLAILSDGDIHTFGYFQHVAFCASDTERTIFADEPHWFIDPIFAKNCGVVNPIPEVGLKTMTVEDVIDNLIAVVKQKDSPLGWQPENEETPNTDWLITLYKYLAEKKSVGSKADTLNSVPLVPDQYSKLWSMGNVATPLFVTAEVNVGLVNSIKALGLPLVSGSDDLLEAIEEFIHTYPVKFIWHLTGPDLVDLLDANLDNWSEKVKSLGKDVQISILDFLSEEKNFETYKSTNRIEKLRGLPILITEDDEIIKPNQPNIFLSAGQVPPPVAGEIRLIQTGTNDRWRKFIQLLGIKELDRPILIQRIITGYGSLSNAKKLEALRWIRKNLEAAEEQLEKENTRSAADKLRNLVAESPLVTCLNGDVVSISRIYDPRVDIIQKVLGDNAAFPDLEVYKQGERQWLEFFAKLGMAKSPRAADILSYIDSLITESNENGADTVATRIIAAYDHIRENWDDLSRQIIKDGQSTITMQTALHNRAWLPARRTDESLTQFPGFVIPENRLFRSSEIHMPRNGHLIASQCSIALITNEPQARIREGLGFPDQPNPDDVIRHFKVLLSKWNLPDHSSIKEVDFETSLRLIYEFIGDQFRNDQISPFITKLRNDFRNIPCIWDFQDKLKIGKKFWRPRHTFREPIPYLNPFRIRLHQRSEREGRGFDALGRLETPKVVDYIELLDELSSIMADKSNDSHTAETVIYSLEQISNELDEDENLASIPVLTRDGKIVNANNVFEFDAPWWEGKISANRIHLLDNRVPIKIRERANIRQLSKHVIEKPLELPTTVLLPEILEQCKVWQNTLRSVEFQRGLIRIIKHTHKFGILENLGIFAQLKKVSITPVEKILTQLILVDEDLIIGKNEGDFYFDDQKIIFFVVAKNEDDLDIIPEFLSQSLNEQIVSFTLSDLSPLVKIIDLPPEKIDPTLTKLRIRGLSYQEAKYSPVKVDDDDKITSSDDEGDSSIHNEQNPSSKTVNEVPGTSQTSRDSLGSGNPVRDSDTAGAISTGLQGLSDVHIRDYWPNRSVIRRKTHQKQVSPYTGGLVPGNLSLEGHFVDYPSENPSNEIKKWSRKRSSKRSGQTQLTISRVFSRMHLENLQVLDNADDEAPHNIEVSKAAVKRVLEYEIETGCEVENMPHGNPGFDVISITPNGNIKKYIEVKGIDGPWTKDGVPLSSRQFYFGQKHEKTPGEEFWLYVVENAKDDEEFKIFPILNPTILVTQFRFDSGWRELATNFKKPLEPAVGYKIQLEDSRIGTISQINGEGNMLRLTISFDDGSEERIKYRKSSMVVIQPGE